MKYEIKICCLKNEIFRHCKTSASCVFFSVMAPRKNKSNKALLLGLGLDNKDGHKRVTQGHKFLLVGGSEETHSTMQEKAVKFNEHLKRRGKELEEISREEFKDIACKLDMKMLPPEKPSLTDRNRDNHEQAEQE